MPELHVVSEFLLGKQAKANFFGIKGSVKPYLNITDALERQIKF